MRHLRLLAALGLGLATPFAIAIEPQTVTSPAPVLTPEEQQLAALSPLSDLIAEGESLTVGDYNAANSGRAMDLGKNGIVHLFGRDCSQVTIGDIMDAQYRGTLHAAGRYQIIGRTMSSAVKWAQLGRDDYFTPDNQDALFLALLKHKRPLVWAYINSWGSATTEGAADALSREWSSIPYWDNRSYYGWGDRAHVPRSRVLSTLREVRHAFTLFA